MAISQRTHVVADFLYRRRARPENLASLPFWIEDQLDDIERSADFLNDIPQVADSPPDNPKIGLRRYAVTPWDPGQGVDRWYTWNGTAWVPDAPVTGL
ncbi:MAG: hypothetical protein AAF608_05065 [Pseudomonadota bacterium]